MATKPLINLHSLAGHISTVGWSADAVDPPVIDTKKSMKLLQGSHMICIKELNSS